MLNRILILSLLALILTTRVTAVEVASAMDVVKPTDPAEGVATSIKDVRVLSDRWLALVVDTAAEIISEEERQSGPIDPGKKKYASFGKEMRGDWRIAQKINASIGAALIQKRPELVKQFNDPKFWKVNGQPAEELSYWPQMVDGLPMFSADDAPAINASSMARIADVVYLKLARPLKNGETYAISGADGRSIQFTFNDKTSVCWSLKVNQVGYLPDAQKKYAYLGMWIGAAGALDFSAYDGKAFEVYKTVRSANWRYSRADGNAVVTGTIKLARKAADEQTSMKEGANAQNVPVSGEDVYELDISELKTEGDYCIVIPGMGHSWPFTVGKGVYNNAYATMMHGMLVQRCGCDISPYTSWKRGACHTTTYKGGFLPETCDWYRGHYGSPKDTYGFRTQDGKEVETLSPFTMVGQTTTEELAPGVKGGWHDAADFDRRYYHYMSVWDFLCAYEMFPKHFVDGQLAIPEAQNGIPDILDEAAWGIDVWKSTQNEKGGVTSWLEQISHPNAIDTIETDPLRFYQALPDRISSYTYAAAAAWYGRLIQPFDEKKSADYLQSAARAFSWAQDDANRMKTSFTISKDKVNRYQQHLAGQTITFEEKTELMGRYGRKSQMPALAAMHLYAATRNKKYRDVYTAAGGAQPIIAALGNMHPGLVVPAILNEELCGSADAAAFKKAVATQADETLQGQNDSAYRPFWLSPKSPGFSGLGWGGLQQRFRAGVVAWGVTKDARYKQAVMNGADFILGCNPMGQSMVTGLGSVYPTVLQHIHSGVDAIREPTPGISPYTFNGLHYQTFRIGQFALVQENKGQPPAAFCLLADRLGREKIQQELDALNKTGDWQRAMRGILDQPMKAQCPYPVLRRKSSHPYMIVEQNEFTMAETVSPLALAFCVFIEEGCRIDPKLFLRAPRNTIEDLPYYSQP